MTLRSVFPILEKSFFFRTLFSLLIRCNLLGRVEHVMFSKPRHLKHSDEKYCFYLHRIQMTLFSLVITVFLPSFSMCWKCANCEWTSIVASWMHKILAFFVFMLGYFMCDTCFGYFNPFFSSTGKTHHRISSLMIITWCSSVLHEMSSVCHSFHFSKVRWHYISIAGLEFR